VMKKVRIFLARMNASTEVTRGTVKRGGDSFMVPPCRGGTAGGCCWGVPHTASGGVTRDDNARFPINQGGSRRQPAGDVSHGVSPASNVRDTSPHLRCSPPLMAGIFGGVVATLGWLLLFVVPSFAQGVTVTAEVDPNPASLDEQVSLIVTINSSGGNSERPQLPKIEGLKWVGGPSVSNQFQWINGQSSSSQSFTYTFLPEREGSFRVPPIVVKIGGKTYQTEEISLKVAKGSASGQSGAPRRRGLPSIFDDLGLDEDSPLRDRTPRRRDVITVAEVDKKTAFVGEQINLTYKILTQVPITQVEIKESAMLKGFWTEEVELPKNPTPQIRSIESKPYTEYLIKKQALFATTPGIVQIPATTFALAVRTSTGVFLSLGTQETVFRKTEPLTLQINPLPSTGKPDDFSGAVGNFKLETSVDKSKAEVGEAINLKVTLSGSGNFRTITDFPLPELLGFKIYSSKSNDSVAIRNDVLQGAKSWEYVVIPQVPGKELLPAMKFAYFSPEAKQYREAQAAGLEVAVLKGKGGTGSESGIIAPAQQGIIKRGTDINYIKLSGSLKNQSRPLYQSAWIYLALLIPLGVNCGLLVYTNQRARLQQDLKGFRSRQAGKVAERRLAEAKRCLRKNDTSQFHAILESSITGYLSDKFNLPQIEITSQQIRRFMEERNIDSHLSEDVTTLLEECNFARYAPVQTDPSNLEALFEKARNAIVRIEREV
jgi:hypothetical protein